MIDIKPLVVRVELLLQVPQIQDDPNYSRLEDSFHDLVNGQELEGDNFLLVSEYLNNYIPFY